MLHHPDRGGDAEKFKSIKAAWELIDGGWSEPIVHQPHNSTPKYNPYNGGFKQAWTKPEPAYKYPDEFSQPPGTGFKGFSHPSKAYQRTAPKIHPIGPRIVEAYQPPEVRENKGDFIARVSISEAYHGFICEVLVDGVKHRVQIPPGAPHNLRFTVPIKNKEDVTVITRFTQSVYQFVGIAGAVMENVIVNSAPATVYRTKDLRLTHEVNAEELRRRGVTLKLQDILGEEYVVKVPHDHDPRIPIKVEGRGYVDWYPTHARGGTVRGSVYITIVPTEKTDPQVMRW